MLVHDFVTRSWEELVARPAGPMGFRFVMQPVIASILAIRDGVNDAKIHRATYFWTIHQDFLRRQKSLAENLRATVRALVLGAALDVLYQYFELGAVRPLETVAIVFVLAFVPYMLLRGPVSRVAKRVMGVADKTQPLAPQARMKTAKHDR